MGSSAGRTHGERAPRSISRHLRQIYRYLSLQRDLKESCREPGFQLSWRTMEWAMTVHVRIAAALLFSLSLAGQAEAAPPTTSATGGPMSESADYYGVNASWSGTAAGGTLVDEVATSPCTECE